MPRGHVHLIGDKMAVEFEIVKNKRGKSAVWEHFGLKKKKVDDTIVAGIAVCKICGSVVKCVGGGTSNMMSHMRVRHHSTKVKMTANVKTKVHSASSLGRALS